MIRYIHGSEDSLDLDVFYVFDKLPTFKECQDFCADKEENRNIITVEDGIVTDCFKGTIDEINNGLIDTYSLHPQQYENVVTRRVERDVLIKIIRVVRCLLSHCSRTHYRTEVKKSLKSDSWGERITTLVGIDLATIDDFGKSGTKKDVYKVLAFQLGQGLGLLLHGDEFYTKSSIAEEYRNLRPFLYREDNTNVEYLKMYLGSFLFEVAKKIEYEDKDGYVFFKNYDKKFDLRKEKYI